MTSTKTYSTPGTSTFTVPSNTSVISVRCFGAWGGAGSFANPGRGGLVSSAFNVSSNGTDIYPGEILQLVIGDIGQNPGGQKNVPTLGGQGDGSGGRGGPASSPISFSAGGGGGGASSVVRADGTYLLIAGGGGGGGSNPSQNVQNQNPSPGKGGDGGGDIGQNGNNMYTLKTGGGSGAIQGTGGQKGLSGTGYTFLNGDGTPGQSWTGVGSNGGTGGFGSSNGSSTGGGGGGGGGFAGGGGGGGYGDISGSLKQSAGGGGGSSFWNFAYFHNISTETGGNNNLNINGGRGLIQFSWTPNSSLQSDPPAKPRLQLTLLKNRSPHHYILRAKISEGKHPTGWVEFIRGKWKMKIKVNGNGTYDSNPFMLSDRRFKLIYSGDYRNQKSGLVKRF